MAILPLQLARVSNLLKTNMSTGAISRTQQRLLEAQNQLITGSRLNAPSDDPGDAAAAMGLQKLLERREAFAGNLRHAQSHLGEVDSTLGDLTDVLQQAQQIASQNVGSDVTAEERAGAAEVVKSLTSRALSLANKQFEGVFLFAGDKSTQPPFVETAGGVKFVGDSNLLGNVYDEHTALPFMVDGAQVFGATSTRVQGAADLTPALTGATPLSALKGATGDGVRPGSIQVGNGAVTKVVDLSAADTVQDVVNAINAAGVGGVTAAVGSGGNLVLSGGGSDDITVTDPAGGTTAADLGIRRATGGGAGVALNGSPVAPTVTPLTPLADLKGGAGIDKAGLVITNGATSTTVDLSAAVTVEDLLNAVNGSKAGVLARINPDGTGIDLVNPTQGAAMTVGENGGTTAADLGIRSLSPATRLADLNGGKGVGMATSGADLQVTRKDGTTFQVDLGSAQTVQDAIDAINAADGGGGLTASFAATGNGIVLTDATGGAGAIGVGSLNFSTAAHDLGLDSAPSGATLAGRDVNAVEASGVFANLRKLAAALESNDQGGITAAAEGLDADHDRVVRVRGQTGARVQEFEARGERLEDENVATKGLLSKLKDTDFTQAISEFTTLQTALQASMQTTAKVLNLSLMDFLG